MCLSRLMSVVKTTIRIIIYCQIHIFVQTKEDTDQRNTDGIKITVYIVIDTLIYINRKTSEVREISSRCEF